MGGRTAGVLVAVALVVGVAPASAATRAAAASYREETFVDTSRPTMASGNYRGATTRTLITEIHVPDGPGPFPVVLWSHGRGAGLGVYRHLIEFLTDHGYLVVAPNYPLLGAFSPAGIVELDRVNQPADASFVISRVIALSNDSNSWLYGRVNADRIAAAGESLGGFTTLGLLNTCCMDRRIRAAVAVAPALATGPALQLKGQWHTSDGPPVLLMHGDRDGMVPLSVSQDFYASALAPKFLVVMQGADHFEMHYPAANREAALYGTLLAFLDAYVRSDAGAFRRLQRLGNSSGVTVLRAVVPCDERTRQFVRSRRIVC